MSEQPVIADNVQKAIDIAFQYAGLDGDHHKMWVIDQMIRALLTPEQYKAWVREYEAVENGSYAEWDEGIAP